MSERRFSFRAAAHGTAGRHEDLRTLLRRPWVLALLVVAATVPPLTVASRGSAGPEVTVLAPQWAVPAGLGREAESVEDLWRLRAVERESRKLAEAYVQKGYRISPQLARDIGRAAHEHRIDLEVAFGLVRAESGFRNSATSPVGATGLTQLMPRTAAWMQPGVTRQQLRDPQTNLRIGFKYLRYLLDKYEGDTRLALLAYNRGPGTVDKALKQGKNPDNGYAAFVMGEKNHGHRLFTSSRQTNASTRSQPQVAQKPTNRKQPARAR